METKHYRLALYESAALMEYDGDEDFTFSYLRTRFKSETAARQVLDEVNKDGIADRQFESSLGGKERVVISRIRTAGELHPTSTRSEVPGQSGNGNSSFQYPRRFAR